jgi:hypothetical protein
MRRTETQERADKALTDAIECVLRAYSRDDTLMDRYMPAEYIVAVTHHGIQDGEEVSMTNVIFKDNDILVTRALGLARYASLYLDHIAVGPDD